MGKIVKYCSTCEESFAEKFSFCPNCTSELSAFEMKPVSGEEDAVSEMKQEVVESEPLPEKPEILATEPPEASVDDAPSEEAVFEPVDLLEDAPPADVEDSGDIEIAVPDEAADGDESAGSVDASEAKTGADQADSGDDSEKRESAAAAFTVPAAALNISESPAAGDSGRFHPSAGGREEYSVTVISDRNSSVKNGLLMGAFAMIVAGFFGVMIYSLFNNLNDIPALSQDPNLIAYLDDTPAPVEELEDKRKSDNKSGGGGGGGKEEPKPASEGVRPPMMKQPTIAPSSKMTRVTDPELKIQAGIQGPIDEKKRIPGRYGVPGSLNQDASDGRGTGGGIGSGDGRGVGSGNGTGFGSGDGSGMGSGSGDGIGDGTGSGNRGRRATTRPASGPSSPFQILSKPRPGYTEAARKNNVTGRVRLRVTFNSNGTIGGITPISRLGHGLTEQAIAAARGIKFTPEIRNGRPMTVKKTVVFNFTIY